MWVVSVGSGVELGGLILAWQGSAVRTVCMYHSTYIQYWSLAAASPIGSHCSWLVALPRCWLHTPRCRPPAQERAAFTDASHASLMDGLGQGGQGCQLLSLVCRSRPRPPAWIYWPARASHARITTYRQAGRRRFTRLATWILYPCPAVGTTVACRVRRFYGAMLAVK